MSFEDEPKPVLEILHNADVQCACASHIKLASVEFAIRDFYMFVSQMAVYVNLTVLGVKLQ